MFLSGVRTTPTGPSFMGTIDNVKGLSDQEDEFKQWENGFG